MVARTLVPPINVLARLVGLWVDLLLYRRAAFAVLSAVYKFLHRYGDEDPRVPRTMPGVVVTELLGLACLAPRLDSPLRAPVDCDIKASDASPFGAAAVSMVVPQAAADELPEYSEEARDVSSSDFSRAFRSLLRG